MQIAYFHVANNAAMKNIFPLVVCLLFLQQAAAQTISTIAGIDTPGYNGDHISAVAAKLNLPFGIAVDAAGNVYISDRGNDRIRKISSGIITTYAGTGTGGYNGDNMPATAAQINDANGIATDAAGNLYIADKSNNRIRKVSTAGIITTIAGNGTAGFRGDGLAATDAQLSNPRGVAVDGAGNVYIADQGNQRIRKVSTSTGIISTVAGTSAEGFAGDGGPATDAELNNPYGVAIDAAGNMYIADVDNERVRKVDAAGIITTFAGNGTGGYSGDGGAATAALLFEPAAVAVDAAGNVFIADAWNSRIRGVKDGIIGTIAGDGTSGYSGDGGPAWAAELYAPYGIALDAAGNIYVADYSNNCARYITAPTALKTVSAVNGLRIFPNPNTGSFTINISSNTSEPTSIVVTNVLGQQIKSTTAYTNQPVNMNITSAPGIYLLQAITPTNTWSQNIVVQ